MTLVLFSGNRMWVEEWRMMTLEAGWWEIPEQRHLAGAEVTAELQIIQATIDFVTDALSAGRVS